MYNRINCYRERANSDSTFEDYTKRKRNNKEQDQIEMAQSGEDTIFKRSKVINRTPVKGAHDVNVARDTEEQIDLYTIMNMLREIKGDMKKDNEKLWNEMKIQNEQIKQLKEDMRKGELKWQEERKELTQRIETLEEKLEKQEKEKKRNNVVIKGLNLEESNIKEKVQEFLEKEMGVEGSVRSAYKIGKQRDKQIIIAEMNDFEVKREVMTKKRNLGKMKVYIENDLTVGEMEIQNAIKRIAYSERQQGRKTKIGYQKLTIDGIIHKWCKIGAKLIPIDQKN